MRELDKEFKELRLYGMAGAWEDLVKQGGLTLPLFGGVLNPRFTRPFCAVPRTSVVHTAWD